MPKNKKIIIATRNSAKVEHYRQIFDGLVNTVLGLEDLGIEGKPEEVGDTAESNALIKAEYYSKRTNLPVFSEDECLYVNFLPADRQPGTNVRRVNGRDLTDDELITHWENIVKKVPEEKRIGHWHFAYCLANKNDTKIVTRDFPVRFYYPSSKIRIPGWPLSSLQGSRGKPHSEYTEEEKHLSVQRDFEVVSSILKQLLDP